MRQKNMKEALDKWPGMTTYGLSSRNFKPKESRLSDILQKSVDAKFYLSPKACLGILRRAAVRGKELPEILRKALERQAAAGKDE